MELLLIRHISTPWNEEGRLQGSRDISPSKIDKEVRIQIEETKDQLESYNIDKCFSSPLKRAMRTAEYYDFNDPVIDDRISEFNFGKYEGHLKREMLNEIGTIWFNNVKKLDLGETFLDFQKRINSFLSEIKSLNTVLVFTHGFVIRYIMARYRENDLKLTNKIEVRNNELYKIEI